MSNDPLKISDQEILARFGNFNYSKDNIKRDLIKVSLSLYGYQMAKEERSHAF